MIKLKNFSHHSFFPFFFSRGPRKDTLNEYRLKVEFLCKVVTRLEAEKLQREAVIASRKSSFSDVPDGASGGKNAAMIAKVVDLYYPRKDGRIME